MAVKIKGSLKAINKFQPKSDFLVPAIENVLKNKVAGKDRNHGWNSPSGVSNCSRLTYYMRKGVEADYKANEPRLQRIFDNGTCVHLRLQNYLLKSGVLLDDEAPLFNREYEIMGTTDGLLLDGDTLAVLEIKSINAYGFNALKDAKEEHKLQAGVYLFCLNELRKDILRGKRAELELAYKDKLNSFLKGDKHYTKQEKVEKQFKSFCKTLDLLEKYPKPLQKVIFLYESKDTQELKEFCFTNIESVLKKALDKFNYLNDCVKTDTIPPIEKSFNCNGCRFREVCKKDA